jgi:hypothetical protein
MLKGTMTERTYRDLIAGKSHEILDAAFEECVIGRVAAEWDAARIAQERERELRRGLDKRIEYWNGRRRDAADLVSNEGALAVLPSDAPEERRKELQKRIDSGKNCERDLESMTEGRPGEWNRYDER